MYIQVVYKDTLEVTDFNKQDIFRTKFLAWMAVSLERIHPIVNQKSDT